MRVAFRPFRQESNVGQPHQQVLREIDVHVIAHVLADEVFKEQPDEKEIGAASPVAGNPSGDEECGKRGGEQKEGLRTAAGDRVAELPQDIKAHAQTCQQQPHFATLRNVNSMGNHSLGDPVSISVSIQNPTPKIQNQNWAFHPPFS